MSSNRFSGVGVRQAAAFAATLAMAGLAQAELFVDEFNDGALDPAWQLSTHGSYVSHTAAESGGLFTVSDIVSTTTGSGSGGITYSQAASISGDFHAVADIAWQSNDIPDDPNTGDDPAHSDMHRFYLRLVGTDSQVLWVGLDDSWGNDRGGRHAIIPGGVVAAPVKDSMPASGAASIEVIREAGIVSVYWEGVVLDGAGGDPLPSTRELLASGTWTSDIATIQMHFHNFDFNGDPLTETFGDLSFDRIGFVPEPASAALLMAGLGLAAGRKRKQS